MWGRTPYCGVVRVNNIIVLHGVVRVVAVAPACPLLLLRRARSTWWCVACPQAVVAARRARRWPRCPLPRNPRATPPDLMPAGAYKRLKLPLLALTALAIVFLLRRL